MSLPIATTALEVADAELLEDLRVGGVGRDHVRQPAGQALHGLRVAVDRQHLGAAFHQLQGQGGTEAAEADHDDRLT
nr:hypothetical protein [Kineosporia sp. NBRC 101677]